MDTRLRGAGSALGVASGLLLAIGTRLPWERLSSTGPSRPGCFGCGTWSMEFSGWQVGNGEFVFFAGLVVALAALFTIAYPAVGPWGQILLAAAVVVAVSATGGWWLQWTPEAVPSAGGTELAGAILGLAAVPLCLPRPARQRATVLAAMVLLCAVGIALAWPVSVPIMVQF